MLLLKQHATTCCRMCKFFSQNNITSKIRWRIVRNCSAGASNVWAAGSSSMREGWRSMKTNSSTWEKKIFIWGEVTTMYYCRLGISRYGYQKNCRKSSIWMLKNNLLMLICWNLRYHEIFEQINYGRYLCVLLYISFNWRYVQDLRYLV
jgi:hypothetical protein